MMPVVRLTLPFALASAFLSPAAAQDDSIATWVRERFVHLDRRGQQEVVRRLENAQDRFRHDSALSARALERIDLWTRTATKHLEVIDQFRGKDPRYSDLVIPDVFYHRTYEITVGIVEAEFREAQAFAAAAPETVAAMQAQVDRLAASVSTVISERIRGPYGAAFVSEGLAPIVEEFKFMIGRPFDGPHRLLAEEEMTAILDEVRRRAGEVVVIEVNDYSPPGLGRIPDEPEESAADSPSQGPSLAEVEAIVASLVEPMYMMFRFNRPESYGLRRSLRDLNEEARVMGSAMVQNGIRKPLHPPDQEQPEDVHTVPPRQPVRAEDVANEAPMSATSERKTTSRDSTQERPSSDHFWLLLIGVLAVVGGAFGWFLARRFRP